MLCNEEALLQDIEELRTELIEIAAVKGMTDERTISLSQSLDWLLNRYDQLFSE
ncbi:MAG TPA: aspartyl-phosphate phosphatase Spo0E family protein [Pseudogracilibacillus sp.]|nr:aspartyl-phosphate phosphatase Spo0E family protein [Pseudogracilibacillus sp.]